MIGKYMIGNKYDPDKYEMLCRENDRKYRNNIFSKYDCLLSPSA